MDIRFKFATICDESDNEVAGFILCFDTIKEADEPFRILIKSYEETNIYEKTSVHFYSDTSSTCSLHLIIHGDESFEAELKGIDLEHVKQLKKSVETQGFFFILTAAEKNNEITLNKNKYICTSRLYMDEKVFESQIDCIKFNIKALREAIE